MKNFNKIRRTALMVLICFLFAAAPQSVAAVDTNNAPDYVYLGGEAFGIKMFSKGAVVVKFEDFESEAGNICPAKSAGIKKNDIVLKADDEEISTNEQLEQIVSDCSGDEINLTVSRENETVTIPVTPAADKKGEYKLGIWVRDSCAGIGTVSYYTDEGEFAALGHGICDSDTGQLMPLKWGEAVKAGISGANKAKPGSAGSLNGYFENEKIGIIEENTEKGIFGTGDSPDTKQKIEIAETDEVKCGKASLYTTAGSHGVCEYAVEIKNTSDRSCNTNKNFVIEITDERLLNVTGGIVQGMSGSPIVQNGKLAGVLNHVFVNTPEKGYCIFAQNMVSNNNR